MFVLQVVTVEEAKALLKEDDDLIIAVYDYWLNKRLRTVRNKLKHETYLRTTMNKLNQMNTENDRNNHSNRNANEGIHCIYI